MDRLSSAEDVGVQVGLGVSTVVVDCSSVERERPKTPRAGTQKAVAAMSSKKGLRAIIVTLEVVRLEGFCKDCGE
jgi:hypothetical protein